MKKKYFHVQIAIVQICILSMCAYHEKMKCVKMRNIAYLEYCYILKISLIISKEIVLQGNYKSTFQIIKKIYTFTRITHIKMNTFAFN